LLITAMSARLAAHIALLVRELPEPDTQIPEQAARAAAVICA
jgi:hypothetical protein